MSQISNAEVEASGEVNINEIIKPYLRNWRWFLLSVFILLAQAIFYIKTATPIYKIQSTVLIKEVKKSPLDFGMISDLSSFGGMSSSGVTNEMEIFKSKKLLQDVVRQLSLQTSVFSKKNFKVTELYGDSSPFTVHIITEKRNSIQKIYPINVKILSDKIELTSKSFETPIITNYNKVISLPYANIMIIKNLKYRPNKKNDIGELFFHYSSVDDAVTGLQKSSDVSLVDKDGTVIGLSLNYSNTDKGRHIINKLVEAYNNDAINDKNSESQKTKAFIDERISIIANELGEVEDQKERFKAANKITDIGAEAQLNLGTSAQVRARLLDTQTQLELTNDLINYMTKQGSAQTLPASVGLNNPTASGNITAYNQLVLERNRMLENATPQNPIVVELTKQIAIMKSAVLQNLVSNKNTLSAASSQMSNEQNLLTSKITKIPAQEKIFRSIERQQTIKENLYLILLQKREETAISLANTTPKARIIDYAYAGDKPIAPKKMITLLAALIVGFLIPFAYIYLREIFNDKIRSKHDLEKLSKAPIAGEIPSVVKGQSELVEINDLSPMSEAFRILITNMNFLLPKKEKGKVVFVTSTIKGEGKTFVSVNLALTLGSPKNKVIIIGADIRNPQLQRYNTKRKGLDGLTEYLYNEDEKLKDIIHVSSFNPYLDVIYSGSIPPNPIELLSNGRYEHLMMQLKNDYDYIIVDTAPLMLVTDTLLSAEMADATLYVTRSRFTEKSLIAFANKQITSNQIKNAAFVVNDVNKNYFGYGNKYGYGYSQVNKSWYQKFKDKF